MKRFLSILVALVVSISLVLAVPVLAASTGNIVDNDLGAQLVGISQQICVQSVTISNPGGAGGLIIDCVTITNTGTAGDADVTQVELYFDTNGTPGSWDASDTLLGSAASFTTAVDIGVNDDIAFISQGSGASADFFVVVTTAAAPTNGNTFQTTIDCSDLTSGTTDTWDGTGGTDTATSATTIDAVAPTVAITSTAPDPTNTSPIPVTATFSENVTGFTVGDITVGNGTAGNFAGGPAVYTFDVTPSSQGAVTVDIAAGVTQDAAANDNSAASQFSITYDSVGPSVVITSTASDPTGEKPIPITVTFSEDVTGFVLGDITVGNGTASNFAGGPAVYTFDVDPTAQGLVTVDIAAGVAQDSAANDNTAATQFTILYSTTVGGTVYPINKTIVLMPWVGLALVLILAIGGGTLALRRRRTR
jgi:hypothetical protein